MTDEKIVLIDGHSILNRAFYGIPTLTNGEGLHTNAVYGFLNIMFKILDEERPQYLAVAFDLHAPTFRHKMYDAYKGTRHPMPEELREQVPVMKDVLRAMNVPLMSLEGFEADDLIGTVSLAMEQKGLDVRIISGDRDLLQLADIFRRDGAAPDEVAASVVVVDALGDDHALFEVFDREAQHGFRSPLLIFPYQKQVGEALAMRRAFRPQLMIYPMGNIIS